MKLRNIAELGGHTGLYNWAGMALLFFYLLIFAWIGVAWMAAVIFVRGRDQRSRKVITYSITFPGEMDAKRVLGWVNSLYVKPKSKGWHLEGIEAVTFELVSDDKGLSHRLRLPDRQARTLTSTLRGFVPGIRIDETDEVLPSKWTLAADIGMSARNRTFRITSPEEMSDNLLHSVQVGPGEKLVIQWVTTPAHPVKPPGKDEKHRTDDTWRALLGWEAKKDEVNDRRDKANERNFLAILRIGVIADTEDRARQIMEAVKGAYASTAHAHNNFIERWMVKGERIAEAAVPHTFPAALTATELASFIGWPLGDVSAPGLAVAKTRHLPAPGTVPSKGYVVARSNYPGAERDLAVHPIDTAKHFHVIGRPGSGKTVLLDNSIAQFVERGAPVIAIDPKRDLITGALEYVPESRANDVIHMDFTDPHPVGYNILGQGSPQLVAGDLQAIFSSLYSGDGVRMPETLYHVVITLMTTTTGGPYSFVDIIPLLWPQTELEKAWSKAVIEGVPDPYIASFWHNINSMKPAERDRYFDPLRARIWQLNARPEIRYVIGQSKSSFDMADVLANKKILLVNLHGLPEESAALIGSLLVNSLWHAVKAGGCDPKDPTGLFLDEFHHFVNLPISMETMLAEARSFGLSMWLAHQHLGQLKRSDLREAVMNNAVNKIVFNRGKSDAYEFAAEFGSTVKDDDFKRLGFREMLLRLVGDDGVSPPMTALAREPLPTHNLSTYIKQASRYRYGRSVAEVEAEIQARRTVVKVKTHRPRLGGQAVED